MSANDDFPHQYQITIREVPTHPGTFDFWIFRGSDTDAVHHGAGYSSREGAFADAQIWIAGGYR